LKPTHWKDETARIERDVLGIGSELQLEIMLQQVATAIKQKIRSGVNLAVTNF
jgi:hypothetical protein